MTTAVRIGRFESRMRFRFRHASADRTETENIIVELREPSGLAGYGEGCPRAYVTGETTKSARQFLIQHGAAITQASDNLANLRAWISGNAALIDANPAAFCAIELAVLDFLGRRSSAPIESLLSLPPFVGHVAYSAVFGESSPNKTRLMLAAYRACGFGDFKIKLGVDAERDRRRLRVFARTAKIRVDANNLWQDPDDCIQHLEAINRRIWAIEEPVAPGDIDAMRKIAEVTGARIILDESLVRVDQISSFTGDPGRWIANIRVSKCGGILRAIELAGAAQAAGLDIILGAHVGETSLLTRAALAVGQSLSRPPLAREGAYGRILLKNDIVSPSLRFGWGAHLSPAKYSLDVAPGLGLPVSTSVVSWDGPPMQRESRT